MSGRAARAFATLLLGAAAAVAAPGSRAEERCSVAPELVHDDPKLPETGARLRNGKPVKIVAIGGSSTVGAAAGSPDKAWPKRLEEALARSYPRAQVTVVNRGRARQTAHDMVDRFPTDVFPENPVLVIWEVGTTDAVRGVDVDEFTLTLQQGIARLREHHVETMLVDMQFSRATSSVINFERYLDALRRIADVSEVYVFKRYDVMRQWVEDGVFNFDDVPPAQRTELAGEVYACLARRIAEAIEIATTP
jgi:lysophospholipase L1-like esterase